MYLSTPFFNNYKNIPMLSTLNLTASSDRLFFGESGHGLARYDIPRYPVFKKINDRMRSLYWNFEEIDMSQERASFNSMTDAEKWVFTENLKRQILLDSLQGRSPTLVFSPSCTDSSLENCLTTKQFFESLHSEAYTYIIKAVYPNPSLIYDSIPGIAQIAKCASSVTSSYDKMMRNPTKESLYLALITDISLESLRFFISFLCIFSYGQRGKAEGSSKQMKMIARDETQHIGMDSHILKLLPKDDPDFIQIIGDLRKEATDIFDITLQEELEWLPYIFQHGAIMGVNEAICIDYLHHLEPKRKVLAGLPPGRAMRPNPVPWMDNWLSDANYQPAPQEVEGTAYLTSALQNDSNDLPMDLEL